MREMLASNSCVHAARYELSNRKPINNLTASAAYGSELTFFLEFRAVSRVFPGQKLFFDALLELSSWDIRHAPRRQSWWRWVSLMSMFTLVAKSLRLDAGHRESPSHESTCRYYVPSPARGNAAGCTGQLLRASLDAFLRVLSKWRRQSRLHPQSRALFDLIQARDSNESFRRSLESAIL